MDAYAIGTTNKTLNDFGTKVFDWESNAERFQWKGFGENGTIEDGEQTLIVKRGTNNLTLVLNSAFRTPSALFTRTCT